MELIIRQMFRDRGQQAKQSISQSTGDKTLSFSFQFCDVVQVVITTHKERLSQI
jgi:hypothetical protein